jgi:hypothetical protein
VSIYFPNFDDFFTYPVCLKVQFCGLVVIDIQISIKSLTLFFVGLIKSEIFFSTIQ